MTDGDAIPSLRFRLMHGVGVGTRAEGATTSWAFLVVEIVRPTRCQIGGWAALPGGAVGTRYVQGLFPESIIPSHRQRTQRAPAMYRRAWAK